MHGFTPYPSVAEMARMFTQTMEKLQSKHTYTHTHTHTIEGDQLQGILIILL